MSKELTSDRFLERYNLTPDGGIIEITYEGLKSHLEQFHYEMNQQTKLSEKQEVLSQTIDPLTVVDSIYPHFDTDDEEEYEAVEGKREIAFHAIQTLQAECLSQQKQEVLTDEDLKFNNLATLVMGRDMNMYQRSLAVEEFHSITAYLQSKNAPQQKECIHIHVLNDENQYQCISPKCGHLLQQTQQKEEPTELSDGLSIEYILTKMESEGWQIDPNFKENHKPFLQYFFETVQDQMRKRGDVDLESLLLFVWDGNYFIDGVVHPNSEACRRVVKEAIQDYLTQRKQ